MENFENLKSLVTNLEEDAEKFYDKRNKAAGTRLRKGCQEIKNLCQTIRVEVSELKKSDAVAV
jgi:phosphate uptake regulator